MNHLNCESDKQAVSNEKHELRCDPCLPGLRSKFSVAPWAVGDHSSDGVVSAARMHST